MKLTKREIDALPATAQGRDRIFFDDTIPGFGLRITPAGVQTFLFQYQPGGRTGPKRRVMLGRYGEVTPDQARRAAEQLRHRVRAGQDPAGERRAAELAARAAEAEQRAAAVADDLTLAKLIAAWASGGLADRSAAHRKEAPRALRAGLAHLLDRPAHTLTTAEVQRVIDAITTTRPVVARKLRDYGRAGFNWARRRNLVAANPFTAVVIDRRQISRDRVLSDAELGEAWRAAGALGWPFAAFIRLLILTLQRRGELAGMAWSELTPDLAVWTIPARRAKNRSAQIVHLPEPARAILRTLPRMAGTGLVFAMTRPGAGSADRPMSGFGRAAARLAAAIHAERVAAAPPAPQVTATDWRWHDFRRTGVTALARLGYPPHVADRLLNHVHGAGAIGGVAAVYQRHEFLAEREAALKAWAEHVLAVAGESGAPGKVIEFRRK